MTGDRGISLFSRLETDAHAPVLRPRGVRRPLAIIQRDQRCCLPPHGTTSAPRTLWFRGSIARPARTPVNASPTSSRTRTH